MELHPNLEKSLQDIIDNNYNVEPQIEFNETVWYDIYWNDDEFNM